MSLKPFMKNMTSLVLRESDSVTDAIAVMKEHRAGAILIGENNILKGIVTERDIVMKVTAEYRNPVATRLSDIMTTNVMSTREDTGLNDAIHIMSLRRIRHLPVVGANGEILGMISLRYLLHDRISELLNELQSLEAYLNDSPGG